MARSLQELVDEARPKDGQRVACRKCGNGFNSYGGHLWCRFCRSLIACSHQHTIHGYIVKRDGVPNGRRWCVQCGTTIATRRADGCGPVLFYDLREHEEIAPCERCGTTEGTQLHHWAPRAIFGGREADRWPTSWLCPDCHALWHRLMREAGGTRLPPEQRIDDYGIHPINGNDHKDAA